jgi:hypothetical protein
MPLLIEEIVPGVVAILEPEKLLNNPAVRRREDAIPFRSGPFVCVQVRDGESTWLNISTKRDKRGLRLELRTEWLLDGSEVWRSAPQFVSDARQTFVGPNEAFVVAGANELPHRPHLRPRVSAEAVSAAVAEVKRYRANAL